MTDLGGDNAAMDNISFVAASATNEHLIGANSRRLGLYLQNTSAGILVVKFGLVASLTSMSVLIPGGAYYEFPDPVYVNAIDGLWLVTGTVFTGFTGIAEGAFLTEEVTY